MDYHSKKERRMTQMLIMSQERADIFELKEVYAPMTESEYKLQAEVLHKLIEMICEAESKIKVANGELKDLKGAKERIVHEIASGEIKKPLPTMWAFNWDQGTKKQIAKLENGDIFDLQELGIDLEDRQMKIDMEVEQKQ